MYIGFIEYSWKINKLFADFNFLMCLLFIELFELGILCDYL